MDTKLTLKLEEESISKAKAFAKNHNTSLSRIVENYFDSLENEQDESQITPLVKQLSGVIELPPDFDYKKNISDTLTKKFDS